MADNFCKICGDILVISDDSKDELIMKCEHCIKFYNRKDDIVLFKNVGVDEYKVQNLLNFAIDDVKNPREYRWCEKCDKETVFVRIVIPDGSLDNIYLCVKCEKKKNKMNKA